MQMLAKRPLPRPVPLRSIMARCSYSSRVLLLWVILVLANSPRQAMIDRLGRGLVVCVKAMARLSKFSYHKGGLHLYMHIPYSEVKVGIKVWKKKLHGQKSSAVGT